MTPPNILAAVPLMHVSSSAEAEEFYCQKLGFSKEWDYRPASPALDPAYLGLRRDDAVLHVSSFSGDGVAGGVASFYVRDVDALFADFTSRGVPIELEPHDQTWGNREMYVRDADNNSLRFIRLASVSQGSQSHSKPPVPGPTKLPPPGVSAIGGTGRFE